jgi:signal peptidase II
VHRSAPWFALAATVVLADRVTKAAVLAHLHPGEPVLVTGFLNLALVFNTGAAFSFLAGASGWQVAFFGAVALVAAAVISVLLVRRPAERLFCAGLAFILGGALGNLWDRITLGKVVDFLDFHAAGWHWPAFNVADSAICVGAAILILEGLLAGRAPVGKGQG